jgi:hypothetical protein
MQRYRQMNKDLHMVFISLEKAYNTIHRGNMLDFGKKSLPLKDINAIKDIKAKIVTSTNEFPITLSLHQRLALSPYMFTLVMDELIRSVENEIRWCIKFPDNIPIVAKAKAEVDSKLEVWRDTQNLRF